MSTLLAATPAYCERGHLIRWAATLSEPGVRFLCSCPTGPAVPADVELVLRFDGVLTIGDALTEADDDDDWPDHDALWAELEADPTACDEMVTVVHGAGVWHHG